MAYSMMTSSHVTFSTLKANVKRNSPFAGGAGDMNGRGIEATIVIDTAFG
jgi:hypothetical protein